MADDGYDVGERKSLAIVQAGRESARTGKPINLAARFGELFSHLET